jgi:hypothetical protein
MSQPIRRRWRCAKLASSVSTTGNPDPVAIRTDSSLVIIPPVPNPEAAARHVDTLNYPTGFRPD